MNPRFVQSISNRIVRQARSILLHGMRPNSNASGFANKVLSATKFNKTADNVNTGARCNSCSCEDNNRCGS